MYAITKFAVILLGTAAAVRGAALMVCTSFYLFARFSIGKTAAVSLSADL